MTPFFQSDSGALALMRDLTFDRAAKLPYLRRYIKLYTCGSEDRYFNAPLTQ